MLNEQLQALMTRNAKRVKAPDWRKTKIARGPSVLDFDDLLSEVEGEEPKRRDAVSGRNRPYGKMRGSLSGGRSFIVDHASFGDQPIQVLAELVDRKLRGKVLNRHQQGLVVGLKFYLKDKTSIRDCSPATIRGLLTALAA